VLHPSGNEGRAGELRRHDAFGGTGDFRIDSLEASDSLAGDQNRRAETDPLDLKPIHWISLRRNEVGAVVPINSVKGAMNRGSGELGMYVEDVRQQRAGLFLRDVAYRIHAVFELCDGSRHRSNFPYLVRQPINDPDEQRAADEANNVPKFMAMFERRARKGQCFNQPYLGCREFGCREFACDFRLVEDVQAVSAPIAESRDLGWMLHDLDFDNPADPQPRFFRAELKSGVLAVPDWSDPEVRR